MAKIQPRPAVVGLAQKPDQEDRMTTIDYIGFDITRRRLVSVSRRQTEPFWRKGRSRPCGKSCSTGPRRDRGPGGERWKPLCSQGGFTIC
jgi:hypothetical protein